MDCCHTAIQGYLAWVRHYLLERALYCTAVATLDGLLHSVFISLLFLSRGFCCPLSPVKVGFDKNNLLMDSFFSSLPKQNQGFGKTGVVKSALGQWRWAPRHVRRLTTWMILGGVGWTMVVDEESLDPGRVGTCPLYLEWSPVPFLSQRKAVSGLERSKE